MNKFRLTINVLAIAIFTFAFASFAQGQATRTWVSGVGDDVNPCSRTAPCKTFAGAFSKTFINGEIDCLDEGGFGAVTLTKSITLEGTYGGGFGSILASGTTGVNINVTASANDPQANVRLRNLSINGTGASGSVGTRTGIRGVNIINASNVYVENCLITDFTNEGIRDARTSPGNLFVTGTTVRNNNGTGIAVLGAGATKAELTDVNALLNGNGVNVSGANNIMVARHVVTSGNTSGGMVADSASHLTVIDSQSSFNGTGVASTGVNTTVIMSRTNVTHNVTNGLLFSGGGIFSFGNNEVTQNGGSSGPFTVGGPSIQ